MALPNNAKTILLEGGLDVLNDTLDVMLLDDSSAYTFDPAGHTYVSDVTDTANDANAGNEMSGTGYSRKTLGTKTTTKDDTDGEGVFDAADTTWTGLDAGTIQTIVIYKQVGTDDTTPGDDPVVAVLDDDSAGSLADLPLTTNGSDVTIQWSAEGIINIT